MEGKSLSDEFMLITESIRQLKESAHMLSTDNLLSRPSIEIDSIRETFIKEEEKILKIYLFSQTRIKFKCVVFLHSCESGSAENSIRARR